jgi:hypothetical protein
MTPTAQDQHRDGGYSLAECLVAAGLFLVLTTMLTATAVLALRARTGLETRLDDSTQGQVGIAAASKVLRTAVLPDQLDDQTCTGCADTAIVQATSTKVSFYANLNNTGQGPSLVTLDVIVDPNHAGTGILRQSTQPPTPLGDGRYSFCTPGTTGCRVDKRILARGLVWPTSAVFGYYDFYGLGITGTALSSDQLPQVSSIDVALSVQTSKGARTTYPASTVVQRVRLPNADINVLVDPT